MSIRSPPDQPASENMSIIFCACLSYRVAEVSEVSLNRVLFKSIDLLFTSFLNMSGTVLSVPVPVSSLRSSFRPLQLNLR